MILKVQKDAFVLRQKLEQELQKLRRVIVTVEVVERGLCLQHLLDGYEARTLRGYDLSNAVVKKLGEEFPELIIEK